MRAAPICLLAALVVSGATGSCTYPEPRPSTNDEASPVVVVAPPEPTPEAVVAEVKPSEPPVVETAPPGLAALVADLAVAMVEAGGKVKLYCEGVQESAGASWAGLAEDYMNPRIGAGEQLHGIGPDGVADWRVVLGRYGRVLLHRVDGAPVGRPALHLMMKEQRPAPGARLVARPPTRPGADVKPLRQWVEKKFGQKMLAVGEVAGVFGDGVDRVVLFKPARAPTLAQARPQSEVALLVAGGAPRGLLPFQDYDAEPSGIMVHLQVGAVFDLDGDGVEEVLWLVEDIVEDGSGPLLQVSYFADGGHHVHDVLRRSYSSVREFGGTPGRYSKPEPR